MTKKFIKPMGVDTFINDISNKEDVGVNKNIDKSIDINTNIYVNSNSSINTDIIKDIFKYNKRAMRKKVMNLRLNDYYATALKALSKPEEGISMQDIMYDIISSGLDKKIDEILKSR